MLGRKAILIDGLNVSFSAIADMLVESILWVFGGEVDHVFVTSDFGDDGGGGDGFDFGVGFDKSGDVRCKWGARKKIDFSIDNNLGKGDVKALN